MRNEAKTCEKFMLFVSQKEAKIMRNGLRFASISHGAKKKCKQKRDTLALTTTLYIQTLFSRALKICLIKTRELHFKLSSKAH
jgi:hypothetical protein